MNCGEYHTSLCRRARFIKPTEVESRQRVAKVGIVQNRQTRVCGTRCRMVGVSLHTTVSHRVRTSLAINRSETKQDYPFPRDAICTVLRHFVYSHHYP